MFTDDQLKQMIRRETISAQYPYSEQDDDVLVDYIKPMLAEMTRAKIYYTMEANHFGSGYASYIQLMCYTDDFVTVTEENGEREEDRRGLFVLISRLAPVVAIVNDAWQYRRFNKNGEDCGGGGTMVDFPELLIDDKYKQLANDLTRLLMKYHFTILQMQDVNKPLPFDEKIRTLSRPQGQYLVWDAVFYWED